jgi:hypothetical protein
MSAPQPARFRARSSAVGAATRARTHAVGAAVYVTVAAEVVAQDRHVPVLDEHRRPRLGPLRLHHVDDLVPRGGEREIVGPLKGRLDRHGVLDPVDPEGALPPFGTGDEVPDVVLVDQAPRVDEPLAALAGAAGVFEPNPSALDDGGLEQVEKRRAAPIGSPHRAGSIRVAPAAASASARKVVGSACTSLRSAVFASSDTATGPTRRNRACASVAVRPLRSVRAPPRSDQPPPRPGWGYTGMPADDSASSSRRAVAIDTSSSSASSAAVTRPRACSTSRAAMSRRRAH